MSRKNSIFLTFIALALVLVSFKPAAAQNFPFIEVIYPQQGSQGTVVEMLVRGAGFESVQDLNAIILNGQEVPILDWAVLTDDAVKVQLMIPEESPIGETEIRFIFDDIAMDAFFIVTGRENVPFIEEFSPQEGQIDTDIPLSFIVSNYNLGGFGGITIGYEEIPVNRINVNDSGEAWEFLVYLPTFLPPGDSVINLYFQNYTFSSYFLVFNEDIDIREQLSPAVYRYDPHEVQLDTPFEVIIEGYVLPELGDLQGITIGNMDLPIHYYEIISDEVAAAGTYLPPEVSPGENRIIFYFENYRYTDTFFAVGPQIDDFEAPALESLIPREAEIDSDVELRLTGENLENLGSLDSVRIGRVFLPILDFTITSPNAAVVEVHIPENAPQGEQVLSVSFENAALNETFLVTGIIRPPWEVLIAVIAGIGALGVVVGGGYAVARAIRKGRTSEEQSRDDTKKTQIHAEYNVKVDLGVQTIEPAGKSLSKGLDYHLEVTGDPGEQTIETEGNSLVDES